MGLFTLLFLLSFSLSVLATHDPVLLPPQHFLIPVQTSDTVTIPTETNVEALACASTFSSLSGSFPTEPPRVEAFYMSALLDEGFLSVHPRITELISSAEMYMRVISSTTITDPNKFSKPCSVVMELQTVIRDAVPTGVTSDELVAYDKELTSWIKEHNSVVTEFAGQCGGVDESQAAHALAFAITGMEECKTAFAVAYGVIIPATMTDWTSTAGGARAWETGLVKEVAAVVGGVAVMGWFM
ncbi:uncharacterized protein PODANS_1_1180 [Podospora anserina S mat+]|uniref:Podospora anserina S mat+ genomic DNA chromosome 1, supercontig 1 n=1 Tax=Podospora anserina (strain S / ATCC MYA-4624 / DSM 980 / FGSC 10383) TaxID=515849 RepID=B2A9N5_PODAN|nr:uncharacterized protein PODANS_1_1180 [Podospora anserina S mat+]CAP59783.1 unnamed protein product [Podospora anserina S mat+]CDP22426.1 Putative protein of unknown function [Podospora anserina S mat+]